MVLPDPTRAVYLLQELSSSHRADPVDLQSRVITLIKYNLLIIKFTTTARTTRWPRY
jgi:hypothetical protein